MLLPLSHYVRKSILTDHSQTQLLSSDEFVRYLEQRGIRISLKELEEFEKLRLLQPVMRLRRRKVFEDTKISEYETVFFDQHMWKEYYRAGMLEFPNLQDRYIPWDSYKDDFGDATILFYHPFQIVLVDQFLNFTRILLNAVSFSNIEESFSFKKLKNSWKKSVNIATKITEKFIPVVGLLILLENAYKPLVENRLLLSIFDKDSFEKWKKWRSRSFDPRKLLQEQSLSIEQIREWRNFLAIQGMMKDPIGEWYLLRRIVSLDKRRKLRGYALLAEEYYKMTYMLNMFLKDITGEEQPEPDDIIDGRGGTWKKQIYGEPFSYEREEIKRKIIEDFIKISIIKAYLLCEGETEEVVIRQILSAFGKSPESLGIEIYLFRGVGNLEGNNVRLLLQSAKKNSIPVFLVVDNEGRIHKSIDSLVREGLLEQNNVKIWNGDFEQDNFGIEHTINVINKELEKRGLEKIDVDEVKREMISGKKNLMRALRDVYGKKMHVDLYEVIKKTELAIKLIQPRIQEINEELKSNRYECKLPIEQVIRNVYETIR